MSAPIQHQITQSVINLFNQLTSLMLELTTMQYQQPIPALSGASIGQHMRHVIELFVELEVGYQSGQVNYENRKRDLVLETDKYIAAEKLGQIIHKIGKPDKPLSLQTIVDVNYSEPTIAGTTYARELLYNIEHAIHHMALIKIGVQQISHIQLPSHFGVAAATMQYREACAQ